MNLRPASAFLVLLAAALSGCVVHGDGNPPPSSYAPGDVHFTWSLAGRTCAENTHISEVRIHIPGESLASGGIYPCAPNGTMGIILHDFRGGSYSYTIEAVDHMGVARYTGSGTFRVNGDVSVHVNLQGSEGMADFFWSFPPSGAHDHPTCAQAGVSYVQLLLDGVPVETEVNGSVLMLDIGGALEPVIPCEFGTSAQGFRVQLPHDGVHQVEIYAMDDIGYTYYAAFSEVAAWSGNVTVWENELPWAVGTGSVNWDLIRSGVERLCAAEGVDLVSVNFAYPDTLQLLYGEFIDDAPAYACDEYGMLNDFLPDGDLLVYAAGLDRFGDTIYLSEDDPALAPMLSVYAGYFCAPNSETDDCADDRNLAQVDLYPF